jgi:hypothetical protein
MRLSGVARNPANGFPARPLEVSLDAPVAPGATIGFELNLEAERDDSSLEGGLEFLCTGGGTAGAASLKGKLGGYIEGKAKDTEKLMTLVSYGFYRRLVESSIVPREVSNYMWGGSTSSKGKKLAERRAAGAELNIFGDDSDAYVETGGVAALEAELLGGGVSQEGKATSGRHYDKESIEKLKLGKYRERKGKGALKLEDADIADLVAGPSKKTGSSEESG